MKRPWTALSLDLIGPIATVLALLSPAMAAGPLLAAPPGEVTGDRMDQSSTLTWNATAGADAYNVYRGDLAWLRTHSGALCHGIQVAAASFASPAHPDAGKGFFYLVTAESAANGEGTAGFDSSGGPRVLRGSCDTVMRNHALDRLGYGWNEETRDRFGILGLGGYLNEQLNPASIDESTNTDLNARLATLVPPDTIQELQALDLVNAVYARRQLEQQATLFWDNHFNTNYQESFDFFSFYQTMFPTTRLYESAKFHYDLQNAFRNLAFNGTFRDIVEASSLSPAMIVFLDTDSNVKSAPNENFARELMELHTMGVDGGYTQQDVVALARVFTGWNVCKKADADANDPLAACIPQNTYGTSSEPPGQWVRNFRINQHDTGQKVLFAGTAYQKIIPDTSANPANGVNDADLALDAIVAHPSTAKFIARELLQRFVDESPAQTMIDAVVAAWKSPANPRGIGDLREVLLAVLQVAEFSSPDAVGNKLKTPFEHVASALRAVRGKTDGLTVTRLYLSPMQEMFHMNPVPTGYSELGGDWLDTNNLLARQNFGLDMTARTGSSFGADVIGLLNANGISTAPSPNNAAAIVDFLADALFGGRLSPEERQAAVVYLNTDDNGVTGPYNDARIRETAGFMLGFPEFTEQ
ncbi:MAG: hypothetical protein AUI47_07465 [Acidobacteria bacterium 13_1_40CM_2_68_5]|nr:MAG: hypothetical protein AUI47_07465 [Acidobacteria bacterium 13_1_40CM_2_68_5]